LTSRKPERCRYYKNFDENSISLLAPTPVHTFLSVLGFDAPTLGPLRPHAVGDFVGTVDEL
jgi:hypothetical protein